MILLKRPKTPKLFASKAVKALRRELAAHFSPADGSAPVGAFDWSAYQTLVSRPVRPTLRQMAHGKCAYCEQSLQSLRMTVDAFRPRSRAMAANGRISPNHYWWLATEWQNLIPACLQCNKAKASRFPVAKRRARRLTRGALLEQEKPLLLDPCRDDASNDLVFLHDGSVIGSTRRGRATIEVLSLNRIELKERRRAHLDRLQKLLSRSSAHLARDEMALAMDAAEDVARFLESAAPFLLATRQTILGACQGKPDDPILSHLVKRDPSLRRYRVRDAKRRRVIRSSQAASAEKTNLSIEGKSTAAREAYFTGQRRIERVTIQNFKAIANVAIMMPPTQDNETCLMLIGVNSTGKSSILQAIALTLMGQDALDKLELDARNFVRRPAESGYVEIKLSNLPEPVRLSFDRSSPKFRLSAPKELVLVLAYGSTRLLPYTLNTPEIKAPHVRARNLFDAYARLQDIGRWLNDRKKIAPAAFDELRHVLRRLLMLGDADDVTRDAEGVQVRIRGRTSRITELSDGYQSVISLAGDIIISMAGHWASPEMAEGIVLIDEIEVHLHPKWKMEIVSLLRTAFPRIAFIFTTHDPLCLRGMRPGEIAVLRPIAGDSPDLTLGLEIVTESIDHLRADQLLTSELFGLGSTRAPSVQKKLKRYEELGDRAANSPAARRAQQRLRKELSDIIASAESPVERLARQIAEKMVSGEIELPDRLLKRVFSGRVNGSLVSSLTLEVIRQKASRGSVR